MKKFYRIFKISFFGLVLVASGFGVSSAQAIVTVSNTAVTSDTSLNLAPAAASALTIGTSNTTGALTIGSATSTNVSIADNNWSITTAGLGTLTRLDLTGSTSGTVTLQTAAAAGTWTLTLPTDNGTANQVLTTDGNGVATWETPTPGGGAPDDATYITQLPNAALTAEQALSLLIPGYMKVTAGGIVSSQSTAIPVADGGTGVNTLTVFAPIFGGTTATGAVQSGTTGTSGQVLTSNGPGVLPTFQTNAPGTGANTSLSNLSPILVAVNESLIPGAAEAGAIDLGSVAFPWRFIFISSASFTGSTTGLTVVNAADTATGTLTLPSPATTDTLVGRDTTDTLTNKTLTTPTIGDFSNAGHDHTDAAGGGQLSITGATTGTLTVARGGTSLTTLTANNVILGNGTSAPLFVAPGASGNVLTSNGTTWTSSPSDGGAPAGATYITQTADGTLSNEQALSTLATGYMKVTNGTGVVSSQATPIPVADGGTGAITLGDAGVLIGNGTGAVAVTSAGTVGQVLTSNGSGVDPTFQTFGGGGANTALSNLASVAVNASLIPGAAGTLALGSGTLPWSDIFFAGTSGTPGTNNFKITGASTGGLRTITFPDASGTATLLGNASTGSGSVVLATSPTLVTPTLGSASATSITLGASAFKVGAIEGITETETQLIQYDSVSVTGTATVDFTTEGLRDYAAAPQVLLTAVYNNNNTDLLQCNPHTITTTGMTIECVTISDGVTAVVAADGSARTVTYMLIGTVTP